MGIKQLQAPVIIASLILAAGCGGSGRTETPCPSGTTRVNGVCVTDDADGGTTTPDTGITAPDTGITTPDTGVVDDGGTPPDAGGPESARLSMTALDFGRTVVGDHQVLAVQVDNPTSGPVVVRVGILAGPEGQDYSVTADTPIGPSGVTLNPNDRITFTFGFTPGAVGARSAGLVFELCDAGCATTLQLSGEGILDAITCAPTTIDFGLINPGACNSNMITCGNGSSHDADILSATLTATEMLLTPLTYPITVPAGGAETINVLFCPSGLGPQAGTLDIEVDHPDAQRSTQTVTLSGEGGGPDIQCAPTSLTIGATLVGSSRISNITCTNVGTSTLSISAIALSAGTAPEFSLTGGTPGDLLPGQGTQIAVTYAPTAAGSHGGTVVVSSSDRDSPETMITLAAEGQEPNGCALAFSPAALDFGGVDVGTVAQGAVVFTNTGVNPCEVTNVALGAGSSPELALGPGIGAAIIDPGSSLSVDLLFSPTSASGFSGTVEVMSNDLTQPAPIVVPVTGQGLDASYPITLSPTNLDFGALQPGCANTPQQTLRVTNTGPAVAIGVSFDAGASSAYTVDGGTTTSFNLATNASRDLVIAFAPSSLGIHNARLRLSPAGLTSISANITGEATTAARNVETFVGAGQQLVDVLLMVDDSGSMSEEQAALAQTAAAFIARADASGASYHIAVTTTDPGGAVGVPAAGTLRGNPTVIDNANPSRVADLQNAINVGVNGSATEEGLFTSAQAVTDPVLLAGPNAGFLRANAELVVVMLSDEDDQSPNSVAAYVAQLQGRPVGVPGTLRIYTITGGAAGCASIGGNASAAPRYLEAARLTGGFDRSICDPSYQQIITDIADATFIGSRRVYALAAAPAPDSLSVYVNNALVPARTGTVAAWGVDYANAQVVFSPNSIPAIGDTVRVEYDAFCLAATCGDGVPQLPEQCDDGNANDGDTCPSTCYAAACGDGFLLSGLEQCDDNNTIDGDGCNGNCIIEGCGNGLIEAGEDCDDGAANSDTVADACRTTCVNPGCGDGVTDTGEQCDDGNGFDTDACLNTCVAAVCGDGVIYGGVEQCDDGNLVDTDGCSNACTLNVPNLTVTTVPGSPLVPTPGSPITWTGTDDDGYAAIPVGFSFSYLGLAVPTAFPSTNGLVGFAAGSTAYQNVSVPAAATPNGFIAWWWDDLNFGAAVGPGASATTALLGTAPNRVRVFTFLNVPRYNAAAGGSLINAEVRLYEGTNVIEVHYGALVPGTTPSVYSATVGWESPDGTAGVNVLGCNGVCDIPSWPTDTIYRYTP
ncbi:MAG: choice-of-anchor D domain-containing protein [Myxococcales bacterium]|nr:choice-of-anchor D domain-containing protein [Myxococcales bacterium]